jgi:hypothetical protein
VFLLFSFLNSGLTNQTELAFENLALRQQLAILKRTAPMHGRKRETGFSGHALRTSGRDGEILSSWSSQKRSSGGIGRDLHSIGPISQNITDPAGREQATKSAI